MVLFFSFVFDFSLPSNHCIHLGAKKLEKTRKKTILFISFQSVLNYCFFVFFHGVVGYENSLEKKLTVNCSCTDIQINYSLCMYIYTTRTPLDYLLLIVL